MTRQQPPASSMTGCWSFTLIAPIPARFGVLPRLPRLRHNAARGKGGLVVGLALRSADLRRLWLPRRTISFGAKRPFGEPTITLEAKAWLTSLSRRKAKELGYPHELWTTRLLARLAREHGPAEGHPCLANTKMAVARVAAPDWSCAGSRGGGANPRHRASGCRRHTAGLRHRACASAGH